jgi:hypothetical protein
MKDRFVRWTVVAEEALMEKRLNAFADAARPFAPYDIRPRSTEDWRRARAAQACLRLVGAVRANLLLVGIDGITWSILKTLLPDLKIPITTWYPGEPLLLPRVTETGTMILHDVGAMSHDDQLQMLGWSEQAVGRTQVVSLTSVPLLPRLRTRAFNDMLYYRLNTVCVDVTSF